MVEVFKTNVKHQSQSIILIDEIKKHFPGYLVNFDLSDCDNIMRVVSNDPDIEANALVELLNKAGYSAEVLPDEILPFNLLKRRESVN